jgi:GxxExxY protein
MTPRGARIFGGARQLLGALAETLGVSGTSRKTIEPDARVDEVARMVLDAALEVHRTLGAGFGEAVYEQALAIELGLRGIAHERQVPITIGYKGHDVGEGRLDLFVEGCLVVELKAVEALLPVHLSQVVSYLRATGIHLGLLITFNVPRLREGIRRVIASF